LKELEDKEQYRLEVLKRFVALENLDAEVVINSAWEVIERMKTFGSKRVKVIVI
jgi:hypothetical protein